MDVAVLVDQAVGGMVAVVAILQMVQQVAEIQAVEEAVLATFVLVVQAFLKVGFLKALAPTQSEPPFLVAQVVVLIALIAIGFVAVRRFRPVTV